MKNENLLIKRNYISENKKIGEWIYTQRKKIKKNMLSKEKIKLLDDINMVWNVKELNFRNRLNDLNKNEIWFKNILEKAKNNDLNNDLLEYQYKILDEYDRYRKEEA